MNDLLERLAAANPVSDSDSEPPSMLAVWGRISEDATERRRGRDMGWNRLLARRMGRGVPAVGLIIPIIVGVAIAAPLIGAHHGERAVMATGTLVPAAQRTAADQLAGRAGAVVALDPRTGAIKVMYATTSHGARVGAPDGAAAALAPSSRDASSPGAAFEVLTAAAALDSGRYTPNSRINGIDFTQALSYSSAPVFARIGGSIPRRQLSAYMEGFGFYSSPSLPPLPALPTSGVRLNGRFVPPSDARVELGQLAIGQGHLIVTPLQMALIASAVGDGGVLMHPHLQSNAVEGYERVLKASTAQALTGMMREVVEHGTATEADVAGLQVAGKTGTVNAAGSGPGRTDAWFIGFAPADRPRIAIAVVVTTKGGFGGTVAAPIAAKVMQELLATRP